MKITRLRSSSRQATSYILALGLLISVSATARDLVLATNVEMECFPTLNQLPPCPVPDGIDPSLVADNPSGKLKLRVFDDDTARLEFRVQGLRPNMMVTAWFVHYRPDLEPPHPIFEPSGPDLPPTAFIDSPVAPTWARYSEGLSRRGEPNQLRVLANGTGRLSTRLDYNPLKIGQVPLVNGAFTTQRLAPEGSEADQPDCCMDSPTGPLKEPIGSSFLRRFDPETGFQLRDARGRAEIVRSPGRPIAAILFVHIDGVTSGLVPGLPVPPILPERPVTAGSIYLLSVFPMGGIIAP